MKVKILGHELEVTFNMAVEIEYEDISGMIFNVENLNSQKGTMQVCYAAMKVANGKVPFTFEEMVTKATAEETSMLKDATIKCMMEWLKVPEVMSDKQTEGEEESEKN